MGGVDLVLFLLYFSILYLQYDYDNVVSLCLRESVQNDVNLNQISIYDLNLSR
jgi:hypothetical protein